jgi:hypothetical protein
MGDDAIITDIMHAQRIMGKSTSSSSHLIYLTNYDADIIVLSTDKN